MGALPPARSQPHIAGRRAAPPLCLRAVTRRPRSRSRSHRRRAGSRGGRALFFHQRNADKRRTRRSRGGGAGSPLRVLIGRGPSGSPGPRKAPGRPARRSPRSRARRSAQSRPELLPKLCPPHPAGTRLSAPGTAAATRVTTASRDRSDTGSGAHG